MEMPDEQQGDTNNPTTKLDINKINEEIQEYNQQLGSFLTTFRQYRSDILTNRAAWGPAVDIAQRKVAQADNEWGTLSEREKKALDGIKQRKDNWFRNIGARATELDKMIGQEPVVQKKTQNEPQEPITVDRFIEYCKTQLDAVNKQLDPSSKGGAQDTTELEKDKDKDKDKDKEELKELKRLQRLQTKLQKTITKFERTKAEFESYKNNTEQYGNKINALIESVKNFQQPSTEISKDAGLQSQKKKEEEKKPYNLVSEGIMGLGRLVKYIASIVGDIVQGIGKVLKNIGDTIKSGFNGLKEKFKASESTLGKIGWGIATALCVPFRILGGVSQVAGTALENTAQCINNGGELAAATIGIVGGALESCVRSWKKTRVEGESPLRESLNEFKNSVVNNVSGITHLCGDVIKESGAQIKYASTDVLGSVCGAPTRVIGAIVENAGLLLNAGAHAISSIDDRQVDVGKERMNSVFSNIGDGIKTEAEITVNSGKIAYNKAKLFQEKDPAVEAVGKIAELELTNAANIAIAESRPNIPAPSPSITSRAGRGR
ncbi:hypothetical protein [Rickettsiales endosymbiont of Peranema trichophorum]|uniref:hypothetical protein n=1 Tax=Rickettsiales endosymbiont of Peranema trichophorum TaxID=2486577 RepID=UPI001023BB64|nr:hypothetical protein [Rickettsiales endosymbiont of Peranema trichophorum]